MWSAICDNLSEPRRRPAIQPRASTCTWHRAQQSRWSPAPGARRRAPLSAMPPRSFRQSTKSQNFGFTPSTNLGHSLVGTAVLSTHFVLVPLGARTTLWGSGPMLPPKGPTLQDHGEAGIHSFGTAKDRLSESLFEGVTTTVTKHVSELEYRPGTSGNL